MAAVVPFVDGWDIVQTLGEGSYGEVKLLYNNVSQKFCAVKIVNCNPNDRSVENNARKEVGCRSEKSPAPLDTEEAFLSFCRRSAFR